MTFDINNLRIGVIGLGYVGLPLAVEFGKRYPTVGFDVKAERVAELEAGHDSTLETSEDELRSATRLSVTTDAEALAGCNFYIVTVPTPIGESNRPVLTPLRQASQTLGGLVKTGDVVVYESTVYPGATEEFCIPIIEKTSGLILAIQVPARNAANRVSTSCPTCWAARSSASTPAWTRHSWRIGSAGSWPRGTA